VSLDQRLRRDLDRDASGIVVDVERNLETVERRAQRRSSVGAPIFLVAAAIVVAAIALRFGSLLPTSGGPNVTLSPTPTPYPCPLHQGTCLGPLQSGVYSTRSFAPRIGYTVPGGWDNTLDTRAQVDLSYLAGGTYTYPDGTKFHDAISIFRRPLAESATALVPLEGIGTTALDLANWLNAHVDLDASGLTPVTVDGAPGYRIEIAIPAGPRTSADHCTTDHGEPRCESLFVSSDPVSAYGFGIVGPETAVVYLVDAPSGGTVMIVIDDADGVDRAGLIAAATPIVNSISFLEIAPTASSGP
jgi:hypothetical protein